jgi:hypothetical protein
MRVPSLFRLSADLDCRPLAFAIPVEVEQRLRQGESGLDALCAAPDSKATENGQIERASVIVALG